MPVPTHPKSTCTISYQSLDPADDMDELSLESDQDNEYDVVEQNEAGSVHPVGDRVVSHHGCTTIMCANALQVGPWTNAVQHTRAAAWNVVNAASRFSQDMYHSGMGGAVVAVASATISTVRDGAQATNHHLRGSRRQTVTLRQSRKPKNADPQSRRRNSIETVPVAMMGRDIVDGWASDTKPEAPERQLTGIIAGPAQRRHRDEGPTMVQTPYSSGSDVRPLAQHYAISPYNEEQLDGREHLNRHFGSGKDGKQKFPTLEQSSFVGLEQPQGGLIGNAEDEDEDELEFPLDMDEELYGDA